jgi:hypothetical protein
LVKRFKSVSSTAPSSTADLSDEADSGSAVSDHSGDRAEPEVDGDTDVASTFDVYYIGDTCQTGTQTIVATASTAVQTLDESPQPAAPHMGDVCCLEPLYVRVARPPADVHELQALRRCMIAAAEYAAANLFCYGSQDFAAAAADGSAAEDPIDGAVTLFVSDGVSDPIGRLDDMGALPEPSMMTVLEAFAGTRVWYDAHELPPAGLAMAWEVCGPVLPFDVDNGCYNFDCAECQVELAPSPELVTAQCHVVSSALAMFATAVLAFF